MLQEFAEELYRMKTRREKMFSRLNSSFVVSLRVKPVLRPR